MISKRVLLIAAAVLVVAATGATAAQVNVNNFTVSQLSIAPDSVLNLDLNASYGIVTGDALHPVPTPFATVAGYIATGYNGGAWGGLGGISSSPAMNDPNQATTLAVVAGSEAINELGMTTFQGHTIAPSDSLILFTYYGDANLDGLVNGDDLFYINRTINNENNGIATPLSWPNGDFNHDGFVNGDDQFWINKIINYENQQRGVLYLRCRLLVHR